MIKISRIGKQIFFDGLSGLGARGLRIANEISEVEKVIVNDVNFDENGVAILNENLQKLELVPTTESWEPYVTISDCNSVGRNCSYKGMLVDYMNIWSKHLNFTWDLHKDITGEWGLKPKSGMYNSSFNIHFSLVKTA